jgi:hypothetical protein
MKYNKTTNRDGVEIISYTDENGTTYSFPADIANSDYQRYLNTEAEQSTPMIPGDE